jgi:DNA recombination-dependent growth factor C
VGFQKGRLTVRRYRVLDPVPETFRDTFESALTEQAFRDTAALSRGEEALGWVCHDNIMDTEFSDRDRWLFDHFILLTLRVDKKVLPSPMFKAIVERRVTEWCQENNRDVAPSRVRTDIRSAVEADLMARTLPRVKVVDACWHLAEGWVLLHNTTDKINDQFRTLFRTTFGLVLEPFSPVDFLEDSPDLAADLASVGTTDFRAVSS